MTEPMRFVVYHSTYGCETGCCGHSFSIENPVPPFDSKGRDYDRFGFAHPYYANTEEERWQWAKEFVEDSLVESYGREHVADLNWRQVIVIESLGDD